jgi:heptosyltransferase-2
MNDSSLMHVAAALGVRQPPLDCAPCFERSCPLGHTRCLNDLSPAAVLARLEA